MVGLPEDDEDRDEMTVEKRMDSEVCDVRVAGVDIASDEDGEKGSQKMDVDA